MKRIIPLILLFAALLLAACQNQPQAEQENSGSTGLPASPTTEVAAQEPTAVPPTEAPAAEPTAKVSEISAEAEMLDALKEEIETFRETAETVKPTPPEQADAD